MIIIPYQEALFFSIFLFLGTGELSTLRQMMEVPNEPGLCPNAGLEKHFLSDQSKARCLVSFSLLVCSGHRISLRLLSLLRVMNVSPSQKKIKKRLCRQHG